MHSEANIKFLEMLELILQLSGDMHNNLRVQILTSRDKSRQMMTEKADLEKLSSSFLRLYF